MRTIKTVAAFLFGAHSPCTPRLLLCKAYQSTMASKKVSVPSENSQGPVPAVLFGDPASNPRGVIVLQEWWGMNQQIQDEAKLVAEEGKFVTIVPDLYRGKVATDNETAGHYMDELDWPGAVKDIQGCARHLLKMGCKKVGVTGFCMGGALSMAAAALVPEVSAAAPFYGIPGESLCDVCSISKPLQCHFGAKDSVEGFSGPKEQEALKKKMAGKANFVFFAYDNCDHAFTNTTGPNYNAEATKLALSRVYEFFNKNLS